MNTSQTSAPLKKNKATTAPDPRKLSKVHVANRRASFDYYLEDQYTAGLVLTGTEIKSIRASKASLVDTYCIIIQGEVWVKNMYVAPYEHGSWGNHAERRDRKLLLNRREIRKMQSALKNPGFTLVPTLLFIDTNGRAKLDVCVARGKHSYDKRETLKEKEDRREMARSFKKDY